jgi:dipeptidyl-peptidase 4
MMFHPIRFGRPDWGRLLAGSLVVLMASPVHGVEPQAAPKPVKANYDLASKWTPTRIGKLVFDVAVTPHWIDDGDRFWYSFENTKGRKFFLVDPVKKSKSLLFDPARMASQLTLATGIPYDAPHVPIRTVKFVKGDAVLQFDIDVPRDAEIPGEKKAAAGAATQGAAQQGGQAQRAGGAPPAARTTKTLTFEYTLATGKLTLLDERPARKPGWASISPDGKTVVFARNHNLYLMDADNYAKALKKADDPAIQEVQLTTDGVEDFTYGRSGQGGGMELQRDDQQQEDQTQGQDAKNLRVAASGAIWSRDSKKIALVRRDQRKIPKLWVINALANPRPTLETYAYAMPGEAEAPQNQLEVFDLATKARTIAKTEAFQDQTIQIQAERPSARAREQQERTEALWLNAGSDKLYFTRLSRDMHRLDLCVLDTAKGEAKPLVQERMNIYIESKPLKLVGNGGEFIWWSERDGWAHYYLYDANGNLKNPITRGEFVTADVSYVDEKTRTMTFTAMGREENEDPYYVHAYRVGLDGNGLRLLDPGVATHAVTMSDSGRFFVDTFSCVNTAPKSVLLDAMGTQVLALESVDLAPMTEAGYRFPEPFKVKADDGITDIYGVMYKPFDFDATRKYPIIAYVYPGPQQEAVTKAFTPRSTSIMLANFGFIVIEVGNRGGNPNRSKWYHSFGYGNLRDYGLVDKKTAIEQLASKYSFIDLDRVGMWGHSGGGFMTAASMLVYPDFFKAGWSESGNHENNIYNNTWSEKHHGVKEVADKDGKVHFEYSIEKNSELAKNLKGHLALITGDIDNNVHPSNTYRMADALLKANKRFEFMIIPGQRHAYTTMGDYVNWARADFFCKWLLGDFSQGIDMLEMNREKHQADKTPRPVAATQTTTTTQVQQQRRRGGADSIE